MPIPFAERAKIQLVSPTRDWGVFWQIGYSRYPEHVRVATLELPLDADAHRAFDARSRWIPIGRQQHIRMQVETMGLHDGDFVITEEHPEWVTTVYWYDVEPG